MIYLFKCGDSFSIVFDETSLSDENKKKASRVVEKLPEGDGILREDAQGNLYWEPLPPYVDPIDKAKQEAVDAYTKELIKEGIL